MLQKTVDQSCSTAIGFTGTIYGAQAETWSKGLTNSLADGDSIATAMYEANLLVIQYHSTYGDLNNHTYKGSLSTRIK